MRMVGRAIKMKELIHARIGEKIREEAKQAYNDVYEDAKVSAKTTKHFAEGFIRPYGKK